MMTSVPQEFRKFGRHCYTLRIILKDTQRALDDIRNNVVLGADLKEKLLNQEVISNLQRVLDDCYPGFLIFGQNCHAKALFINLILDQPTLPLHSCNWRWVRLSYGHTKEVRVTLGQEYEIVETLKAHEKPWITVPESDILRSDQETSLEHCPALEIKLNSSFLKDKVNVIVPPDCCWDNLFEAITKCLDNVLPVIIYVVGDDILNDGHIQEIRKIKETYPDLPLLFVSMSDNETSINSESLTESDRHFLQQPSNHFILKKKQIDKCNSKMLQLKSHLLRLGYLNDDEHTPIDESYLNHPFCSQCAIANSLIGDYECKDKFVIFVRQAFKAYLLRMSTKLSEIHNHYLKSFILTAFDMAREIQITPRRIKYAQATEGELYKSLMKIASQKQEEILKIIQNILQDMKSNAAEVLEGYYYRDHDAGNIRQSQSPKLATMEIQQIVLHKLGSSVAKQLVKSVGCLHESFTGTLQRCLENLEKDCHEPEGNLLASDAVKQIISAAYSIELKSSSSFSVVHSFMERLRKLLHSFQMPWNSFSQPQCDLQWQLQVVINIVDSLSSSKLAKAVSTQFQEVVKSSNEAFQSAMRSLENQLSGKLEQTEEQRLAIRKQYAPRFARLALESTSLCDLVQWGMPVQNREIGRGQYGVVFACEKWGGIDPCAVKSVVPPDDRHWNDLAMEFYYTRTIPEHPRIVKLRGSVIDHQYGAGCSSAVLLIMERMTRDLYCGLRNGLSWPTRLQIAIDVVDGIRYLHSQGLMHRDIKLKNVLLDNRDRAKLTDFGFCIPEAMMSGSIVGTPVHMAPELLSGHYDSSVDVYAFGILFWYICANQVRLPFVFEHYHNKEQLWISVRKGVRPECLAHFSDDCWDLMERCWSAEPSARPLLGNVQPILEAIKRKAVAESPPPGKLSANNCSPFQKRKLKYDDIYYSSEYPLLDMKEF